MISVVRLWETLMQSAKTGTAGYQSEDEFNRDLDSVQTIAMSILCPKYASNTYVQEMLRPFVVEVDVSTVKPENCFYFLGATINDIPSYPITPVQASLYRSSPIRQPSAKNPAAYHYFINDGIEFIHTGTLAGTMQYIRTPAEATIVLTPVSTENRDYEEPTAGTDLEWPEKAFNLLLALMQQKLGIELKEDILITLGAQSAQQEIQNV